MAYLGYDHLRSTSLGCALPKPFNKSWPGTVAFGSPRGDSTQILGQKQGNLGMFRQGFSKLVICLAICNGSCFDSTVWSHAKWSSTRKLTYKNNWDVLRPTKLTFPMSTTTCCKVWVFPARFLRGPLPVMCLKPVVSWKLRTGNDTRKTGILPSCKRCRKLTISFKNHRFPRVFHMFFYVYSTPGILNLSRGFRASQGGQSQLCGQQARFPTKVEATSAMKEGSQHLPTMVSQAQPWSKISWLHSK